MTRHADEVKLKEARELDYHERCRAVCGRLRVTLKGSSINGGFSTIGGNEVQHPLMEELERLLAASAALAAKCERLEGLVRESASTHDCYCNINPKFHCWRHFYLDKLAAALSPQPEGDKT